MALAGHPRAMKSELFSPQSLMALAGHPRAMKSELFSPQGPPRPGATSGHENRAGQQRQRQLFSDESYLAFA